LSSSEEAGWNATAAFASVAANIPTANPTTTHPPERSILISPDPNSCSISSRLTKLWGKRGFWCRREPRTRGGAAFSAATTIPPPPNYGPLKPEFGNRTKRLEYLPEVNLRQGRNHKCMKALTVAAPLKVTYRAREPVLPQAVQSRHLKSGKCWLTGRDDNLKRVTGNRGLNAEC
jgi:hypothetical protein